MDKNFIKFAAVPAALIILVLSIILLTRPSAKITADGTTTKVTLSNKTRTHYADAKSPLVIKVSDTDEELSKSITKHTKLNIKYYAKESKQYSGNYNYSYVVNGFNTKSKTYASAIKYFIGSKQALIKSRSIVLIHGTKLYFYTK